MSQKSLTSPPLSPSPTRGFVPKVILHRHFWNIYCFCSKSPELGLNPQFVHALDKDGKVVSEHLTQDLVHLGCWRLGADGPAELGLYHREGRFYVAPLVIVGQKVVAIEVVVGPHILPQSVKRLAVRPHARRPVLEGNKWPCADGLNCVKVTAAGIGFITRHFPNNEVLSRLLDQGRELGGIRRFRRRYFHASHHVRCHSAHQMGLHPLGFAPYLAPLVIKPPVIGGGGEARGIHGEVRLNGFEGKGALLYKALQDRGKSGVFKAAEQTGKRGSLVHQAVTLGISQVGHKAASRHGAVDLVDRAEHHVTNGKAGPSKGLWWLGDCLAQSLQKFPEPLLLVSLGGVVCGPVLSISDAHRFGEDCGSIRSFLSADGELYGVNVFAGQVAGLKVWAATSRLPVHVDQVQAPPSLRRDKITLVRLVDSALSGDYQALFFSCVHTYTSLLGTTNSISYSGLSCQENWYILLVNHSRGVSWLSVRKLLARFFWMATDAAVGTNGSKEVAKNHEYVQSAKALTGTGHEGHQNKGRDMGCNVRQYLPSDDSPEPEIEHIIHLPMVGYSRPPRRRRGFMPTSRIELVVDTEEGHSLDLVAYRKPDGELYAELHNAQVKLRSLHTHDGHRNPDPERTPVSGPHMHFPSRKFPLLVSRHEYAYPIEMSRLYEPFDILQFFCQELDIRIDEHQFQLDLGGRRW